MTKARITHPKAARAAVLCALGVFVAGLSAAELNFSASVDRTTVGLGEQLQLIVTVEGTNIGAVPRPQLPDLSDFNNYGSTSSQSTNISFVNGRMTQQQTISFIYTLEPKRVAALTIGPVRLDHKGMVYETQPITVSVTKESQAPPPRAQPSSPWGMPQRQRQPARGNCHVVLSVDRTTVYVGEQATATYTFYAPAQVANLSLKDVPGFTGFWAEKVFDAKDLNWRATTYEGKRYNAATIKQVALFPTQSGSLSVDKMTLSGQLVVPGFFFDEGQPFEVSSDPVLITAKPLPEDGRPADFSGGVGDFVLSASLSKDKSEGGEPLTYILKVSGTGNIGIIGEPRLAPIAGVRVLQPETKGETHMSGGRLAGSRTFSYPVIPLADGRHVLPEVTLSFFNPKTGRYYTLKAAAQSFVAAGATGKSPVVETESGVKVLGTDIAHIKTSDTGIPPAAGWWTWLFYPAGLAFLGIGAVAGRHRRRIEADRGYARRSRSGRLVKKRLSEATKLLGSGREHEFYAALSRAVTGYVGDRFNIEAFGMTGDQLGVELARRGVEAEAVQRLLTLVADCDAARFSPGIAACSPQETLDRARSLLETL
jgi:hypothetical protein